MGDANERKIEVTVRQKRKYGYDEVSYLGTLETWGATLSWASHVMENTDRDTTVEIKFYSEKSEDEDDE